MAGSSRKRSFASYSSGVVDDDERTRRDDAQMSILATVPAATTTKQQRKKGGKRSKRRRRRGGRRRSSSQVPKKIGDYVCKFQDGNDDDNNNKQPTAAAKCIHPKALRHTLGMFDELGKSTIKSITKSLKDEGREKASRTVQVRSKHHVKAITAHVREKLHDAHIPNHYVRIQDVMCLHDMESANQRRRDDITTNESIEMKLECQLETVQKQYDTIKRRRDVLQHQLDAASEEINDEIEIHPLLLPQSSAVTTLKDDDDGAATSSTTATTGNSDNVQGRYVYPAADEGIALVDWLKTVPSPYD